MPSPRRGGLSRNKSLDLGDVFGFQAKDLSKTTPYHMGEAKSEAHPGEKQNDEDGLTTADMSDTGRSVSSSRSHARRRGSRRRIDRSTSRSRRSSASSSALNKSIESGMLSFMSPENDSTKDDDDEMLFQDKGEKKSETSRSLMAASMSALAATPSSPMRGIDRSKLRERMRRARSGIDDSGHKERTEEQRRSNDHKRGDRRPRHDHKERGADIDSRAHKERHSEHRRSNEKERTEKRRSNGSEMDKSEHKERRGEKEHATGKRRSNEKERAEKRRSNERRHHASSRGRDHQKTPSKASRSVSRGVSVSRRPSRSTVEVPKEEHTTASPRRTSSVAMPVTESPMRSPARAMSYQSPRGSPGQRPSPRRRSPQKLSPTPKAQTENTSLRPLMLRKPSFKEGEQSPRSLTEMESSFAEEASRAGTMVSGVSGASSADDSEPDSSDDGTVLQFDPTQSNNVHRVRQVTGEDSAFSIKKTDGSHFTGHIAEFDDPLADAHLAGQQGRIGKPVFGFLDSDPEVDLDLPEDIQDTHRDRAAPAVSGGEEEDDEDAPGAAPPVSGGEEDDEDAPGTAPPVSGGEEEEDSGKHNFGIGKPAGDWNTSFVSPPSMGGDSMSSGDNWNESFTRAPSGSDGEMEDEDHERKARRAPRRGVMRSKSLDVDDLAFAKAQDPLSGSSQSFEGSFGDALDYQVGNEKPSVKKKKKFRRRKAAAGMHKSSPDGMDAPSDTETDTLRKPRRRLKKKKAVGGEQSLGPNDRPLRRKKGIKQTKLVGLEGPPEHPGAMALDTKDDDDTSTGPKKHNKRISVGLAGSIGRYFGGRRSSSGDGDASASESDTDGSISSASSSRGRLFGRGGKNKNHLLLGDSVSSFEDDDMPF